MSALVNSFNQYQFSQWECIVLKFIMITFPIMCTIEVYYF